jgi:transposase
MDAVHPTHAARPADCWAPRGEKLAILPASGRQRINIHGANDLETGQPCAGYSNRLRLLERLACFARMIEAETVDALSANKLLEAIEPLYPMLALIHVFRDNARYHHPPDHSPGVVQDWLAQPGRRVVLYFIPPYRPHLNPIERLWAVKHKHVTHNKCYVTCGEFADAAPRFLREKVPEKRESSVIRLPATFASSHPRIFGS